MKIHDYHTTGGKNLIKAYLHDLPKEEQLEGYRIRFNIIQHGIEAFPFINTRQLEGKLWEIKFSSNRIMYVLADAENVYFLHACKKQKGKTEQFDLDTAKQRAKEIDLI